MTQSNTSANDKDKSDHEYIEEKPENFDVDEYEQDDSEDEEENKE